VNVPIERNERVLPTLRTSQVSLDLENKYQRRRREQRPREPPHRDQTAKLPRSPRRHRVFTLTELA
jgi:hypothetical protein